MSRHTHGARWQHHARRHAYAMLDAAIQHQQPNLQRRADDDSSTASKKACEGDDSDGCEKPAGATSALPIVLGSLIPIFFAGLVLIWLHRRHMNKLKEEDTMDRTKSMDFGLGGHTQPRLNPGEKSDSRARRQMSMDMSVNSPYLMPGVIHDSRESLNTLARSPTGDDRYAHSRPSTSGNGASTPPRSHSARPNDRDSSIYAPSGFDSPDGSQHSMNAELLSGASRMATTSPPPPRKASLGPSSPPRSVPQIVVPSPPSRANGLPSSPRDGAFPLGGAQSPETRNEPHSDRGLPASLMTGVSSPTIVVQPTPHNPASQQPLFNDTSATYMPEIDSGPSFRFSVASEEEEAAQVAAPADARKSLAPGAFENRRLSMGSRPLPPDGKADDTAEERAMRIRSFYKEYFSVEESGPPPPMPTGPGAFYGNHADYSQEHGVHDEPTGGFMIPGARPFAEGPVRRAMTPPPRMPPRFQGHGGPPSNPGSRAGSAAGGRFMPPQPRSFSSASNHMGGPPRGPAKNKRPLAPPEPLSILPTPSMLREDAFAMPIIFAPNVRGEEAQPRGGLRPYSPAVPAFNPLISSFDDMALLPSPHMLRKSGYFTALDFAPPQKFKNDDGGSGGGGGSDAGSIRSHRSGTSAMHQQNIRQGAYRVSRLPTDVVPMKDDLAAELRPTWDVGRPT